MKKFFTSESVTEGHPDKICDQISDAVLDAILEKDPMARVACETSATTGLVLVMGEISTHCYVDIQQIARDTIREIGYDRAKYGFDCDTCAVLTAIHDQSADIALGVDNSLEHRKTGDEADRFGAGDQGIVVGYATNETDEYLPLPAVLAHRICKRLDELKPQTPWLGADGKAQVTVAYENDVSVAVTAVVVSLQHDAEMDRKGIRRFVGKEVLGKVLPKELLKEDTSILIHLPVAELQQHDQSHGF